MMSLESYIIADEDYRKYAYYDTLGNITIGYGFTYLTREECDLIIELRIKEIRGYLSEYSWYNELNTVRKYALINMVYQMGIDDFKGFVKTIAYLEKKDFENASKEMLKSRWYEQTPKRAERISKAIRTGGF